MLPINTITANPQLYHICIQVYNHVLQDQGLRLFIRLWIVIYIILTEETLIPSNPKETRHTAVWCDASGDQTVQRAISGQNVPSLLRL